MGQAEPVEHRWATWHWSVGQTTAQIVELGRLLCSVCSQIQVRILACLCDGSGAEAVVDLAVAVLVAARGAGGVRVAEVAPLQVHVHFAQPTPIEFTFQIHSCYMTT